MWAQAKTEPQLTYSQVAGQVRGAAHTTEEKSEYAVDLAQYRTKTGALTVNGKADAAQALVVQLARKWMDPVLAGEITAAWLEDAS